MPKTMKALVVHTLGKSLELRELPVPDPGDGEVLVKIEACGVCHTDVHAADGDWPIKPRVPFVPGHEGVGRIVALGRGVKNVREGDRVGVPWLANACGACDFCLTSRETMCESASYAGYTINGGFAEYCAAPAAYVGRIPEGLGPVAAAPILCAGVTTYKGIKMADCQPGEWIAISGIGGLGHLAVQYARAMGLRVVAIDVDDDKLDLARHLGARVTVNAQTQDAPAVVQREVGGVHGVLITAVSRPAFAQGTAMLRRGGTCVLNGLPPGEFPLPIFDTVFRCITVRGSLVGTRADLKEALSFAGDAQVKATIETAPLDEANDVLERLRQGKVNGRVVLTVTE